MAALADMILIVEAGQKSGTLITARLALDYNKDLGVIPNSIFSQYSLGSNELLKQGAYPVFSGKEILELLSFEISPISEKQKQERLNFDDFNPEEKKILKALQEPKNKEELQDELKLPTTTLNTNLSILEIKGVIVEKLGKFRLK